MEGNGSDLFYVLLKHLWRYSTPKSITQELLREQYTSIWWGHELKHIRNNTLLFTLKKFTTSPTHYKGSEYL